MAMQQAYDIRITERELGGELDKIPTLTAA
jgi:hypothetical protein